MADKAGASEESGQRQTLLLWALLAAGGEALQMDLPIAVTPHDRQGLEQRGLVRSARVGPHRAVQVTVTDAGWSWAGDHLTAPLPPRVSKGATRVLHGWLAVLDRYRQAAGVSLADIFTPVVPSESRARPAMPAGSADRANQVDASPTQTQHRIVAAYTARTGKARGASCNLRLLREDLPDVDRNVFDHAIHDLVRSGRAALVRNDNRFEVTPADDAAGIVDGGQVRHLLWVK